MSSIHFFDSSQYKRTIAFGQMVDIAWACYNRGKELGYDDISVEWHNYITIRWFDSGVCMYGMNCPRNDIYPLRFVKKGTYVNADKYIDLSKPDSLFVGCNPIFSEIGFSSTNTTIEYFNRLGNLYKMELKIQKPNTKYILFHYRKSEQKRQLSRNIDEKVYIDIINHLKRKYKDYKFYKIGEKSSFDNLFDICFGYFLSNTDGLFKLIYGSSAYIGPLSGPISIAWFSDIPTISLMSNRDISVNETKRAWHTDNIELVSTIDNYIYEIDNFMEKHIP